MQTIRNLNILILAFLLILTGCFGLADDAVSGDAEGQTNSNDGTDETSNTGTNNPPFISDNSLLNSMEVTFAGDFFTQNQTTNEEELMGYYYNLYHAVIDIDGDNITSGWDIDLDGMIDNFTTSASGFTTVFVPIEYFENVTLSSLYDFDIAVATVAFIAQDEHGLGSAIFVDVLGTDDFMYDDEDDGSQLVLYTFSGQDAPGSDGTVIMTMDTGSDLGWASIVIKASVDGAASSTVPMCDDTTSENCWSSTDTDDTAAWNVGEAITVDTSCTGVCTVTVNVLNDREGTTLDTTVIDVE